MPMGISKQMVDGAAVVVQAVLPAGVKFVTEDVPTVLQLIADALKRMRIPTALNEWSNLSWSHALDLAAPLTAVLVFASMPFFLLRADDRPSQRSSYWLTRVALLRGLGLCYLAAFGTAAAQLRGLFGSRGLAPATFGESARPTPVFDWLEAAGVPEHDWVREGLCWAGVWLSLRLMCSGSFGVSGASSDCTGEARVSLPSAAVPLALWLLYLSLLNGGTMMMNYGWEWLTLELGFIGIFLCPVVCLSATFPNSTSPPLTTGTGTRTLGWFPPPRLVLWLFRWCAFRLLIGAGMSKLGRNSSACWRDLTCTTTHYETQPMPNPVAWLFHRLPLPVHQLEVALTFFEQLVLPFFMLVPYRPLRLFSGMAEVILQLGIVGTGNYAWINFVGVLPVLALFDDAFLAPFFTRNTVRVAAVAEAIARGSEGTVTPVTAASNAAGVCDDDCDGGNGDGNGNGAAKIGTVGKKMPPKRGANANSVGSSRKPSGGRSCCSAGIAMVAGLVRWLRGAVHVALVCFIAVKSVDPIKELFTPAPWLHFYDDYFFVNSQGVFGFINAQRTVLVLRYTHDALPPAPDGFAERAAACRDSAEPLGNDEQGRPLGCAALAHMCGHPQHGALITRHCPRACGQCPTRPMPDDLQWEPLDFKNLPGDDLTRRPFFNSPFHYRLDWQVWIETTASMDFAKGPLRVPALVQTLIRKVLAGDSDAVGLLGSPHDRVLPLARNGTSTPLPPTAIRADWYRYTLSSWDVMAERGEWWERTPVPGAAPSLFTAQADRWQGRTRRSSAWCCRNRQLLLLLCTLGANAAFGAVVVRGVASAIGVVHMSLLLHFVFCFGVVLLADYDDECHVSLSLLPQETGPRARVECSAAINGGPALTCDAMSLVAKLDASAFSVAALHVAVLVLPSLVRRKPALVANVASQCCVALGLALAVALVPHFG